MAKNFQFGESPVAKMADDIRNDNKHVAGAVPEPEMPAVRNNQSIEMPEPDEERRRHGSVKKPEVGVTIQLPKKYYRTLRDIKDETGIPLRDLALRAVIEYIDNYQFED